MKLQCVWKSASSPSLSLWVFTFSLSLSLLLSSRPVFCPTFIFGSEPGTLRPPAPSHLRCCNKLGSFSSSYRFSWKLLWGALYFLDRYVFCSAGPTQLCIYATAGRVEWLLTTWNRIKKKEFEKIWAAWKILFWQKKNMNYLECLHQMWHQLYSERGFTVTLTRDHRKENYWTQKFCCCMRPSRCLTYYSS